MLGVQYLYFYNAAFHLTAGPGSNVGWRYLFLLVPFLLQTKDFVIIETTTKKSRK